MVPINNLQRVPMVPINNLQRVLSLLIIKSLYYEQILLPFIFIIREPTVLIRGIFPLQIASNEILENATRTRALSLISWLVTTRKKSLLKLNLVPDVLSVLFPLISSPLSKEEEEIAGEETQHPSTVAGQVLDSLSLYLPPEKIFGPSLAIIEPLLVSEDPWQRKAGLTAIGVISEGCSDYVRNNYLAPALRCVCQGLADQQLVVQKAALFALGQFSLNLQPDVSKYSGEVGTG